MSKENKKNRVRQDSVTPTQIRRENLARFFALYEGNSERKQQKKIFRKSRKNVQ